MDVLRIVRWMVRAEWPVRVLSPVIGRYNPFHPSFRRDPYRVYRRLQQQAPVYFSPALRGWIVSRHGDVVRLLSDPRLSCDRRQASMAKKLEIFESMRPDLAQAVLRSLLMIDPPDHTRVRRLVSRAFTPRVVDRLADSTAGRVAELLDAMEKKGDPDVIRDLADPLPLAVIADLLGIPEEDRVRLKALSNDFVGLLDPIQAEGGIDVMERAFDGLLAVLHRLFAARRREPRDDLVSGLVRAGEQGDVLSEAELDSLCLLLLVAGNETTTNLIGNAIDLLIRHPDARRDLAAHPEAIETAVEEFLRMESSNQLGNRRATIDTEIGGAPMPAGTYVHLCIGAANRDPDQFPDPDRLDIRRHPNRHLAFGFGIHTCAGNSLARMEAEVAIEKLVGRFRSVEPAGSPVRGGRARFRGFAHYPIAVRA